METPLSKADVDALIALYGQGKLAEVIADGEPLVRRHPQVAVLHNILGAAYAGLKRGEAAADSFRDALRINPQAPEAHNNLGNALKTLGRIEEAMDCYRRALAIQPANPQVHNNLANGLRATGRIDEAIAGYEQALRLQPGYAEAMYNLGVTFRAVGRREEALELGQRALTLKPDYADAFHLLGSTLKDLHQRDEAIGCFQAALMLKPDHAESHHDLGNLLADLGRRDEAIASYSRALAIKPDRAVSRAQRLYQQAQICDWDAIAADAHLIPTLGIEGDVIPPFTMLSLDDDPARNRRRSERYGNEVYKQVRPAEFAWPTARPPRLRIGYFSADFHNHAIMFLMAQHFELHDRARFEIHAYSYGAAKDDEMRRRARAGFDHFHDVRLAGDREIADLARSHGIDIAVDMMGYTRDSRTGILANRPAPIQITYMGYPGTLGLPFVDYLIADKIVVPPERRAHYAEKIIYLPDTYYVTDDGRPIGDTPSRAAVGLPEQGFVFVNFNASFKITREEFSIWVRLLHHVEGSVLWLLATNAWAEANLRREAAAAGLSPDRLVFAPPLPQSEHIARHRLADLFLDNFNYNAHTTATDALWAGLPLVTKAGESFTARVAASLLQAIDLPELITPSPQDYEARALELATNPPELHRIREKLAQNRLSAALFDSARFTRNFEAGFDRAHADYVAGTPPRDIELA